MSNFSPKFDAVINVAGGFTSDKIKDEKLFENLLNM